MTKQLILTEHQECVLFNNRLKQKPYLLTTKIAQETRTKSRNQKRKNKLEGLNRGFPDYVIVGRGKVCCVEMKRKKGGTVSKFQERRLQELEKAGIPCKVCLGAKEAILFVTDVMCK